MTLYLTLMFLATVWHHYKLGSVEATSKLEPTAADANEGSYVLRGNEITINANSKKRDMMGDIACSKETGEGKESKLEEISRVKVTGSPVFKNIANALTVLDKDQYKRIECEVTGYPIPTVSWKFQSVEKEQVASQCQLESGECSYVCNSDNCDPKCEKKDDPKYENHDMQEDCIAEYYENNAEDLFVVMNDTTMADNIEIRYVNTAEKADEEADGCPMDDTPLTDPLYANRCKQATKSSDVSGYPASYKPKTQLFFTKVQYSQGGKYICVATQAGSSTRTKPFIWRVKDPMAALWPFLALVAEVIVVVCIILYYERASQKKENVEEADEGDEFIATKKDES